MTLNIVEKALIKYFLQSKKISIDDEERFFSDIPVKERRFTSVGSFTDFEQSKKLKVGKESETYVYSELGAKVNDSAETGYLVYIKNGYIDCIEGFTYGEPWPVNITHIQPYTLSD